MGLYFSFLEDFLRFCQSRGIRAIIAEGQVNPATHTEKVRSINRSAVQMLSSIHTRFPLVRHIPASENYESAQVVLDAEVLSAPRPNRVELVLNGKPVSTLDIDSMEWKFHKLGPVSLSVSAGPNTLHFASREPPLMGSDGRPRAIAVQNLTLRTKDGRPLCEVPDCAVAPPRTTASPTLAHAPALPSRHL